MHGPGSSIGRWLGVWINVVLANRWLVVSASLLVAVASVFFAANNLGINTDTANMISDQLPWRRDFIDYRDSFPIRDRNLVVVIKADTGPIAERFAKDLATALRREPELFPTVFLAGDGEFFERNGLLYLSPEALETLGDRLIDAQPLLGLISQHANGAAVIDVVSRAVAADSELAAPAMLDSLFAELSAALRGAVQGMHHPVDWRHLISIEQADVPRNIILVQPELDFSRVRPARPAIERLRGLAAEIEATYSDPVSVHLTGTLAMEHEELDSVTRGAAAAGLAALFLVALVLIWALRSIVLLLIALGTLLAGLAGTAALAAAVVGHLNLLSVAFAVLYVGLGVDFILHVSLRLKERVADGQALDAAILDTMKGVGASLVICAVTTAAGFYSFIPTPFEGVSELGLISGNGMFVSLLASVTTLPALLACFYKPTTARVGVDAHPRLAPRRNFSPRYTLLAAGIVVIGAALSLPLVRFDNNPIHLRDPSSESVMALEELAESGNAAMLSLVAVADDAVTAQRWASELAQLDTVANVVTSESLVPSDQSEKALIIEDIAFVLGPSFAEFEPAPPDPGALLNGLGALDRALRRIDSPSGATLELRASIESVLAVLGGRPADARLLQLDSDLLGNLEPELHGLAELLTARPFGREALPRELEQRWFDAKGRELIEIVPAENINNNAAAERFVDSVRAVLPRATGLPVVYEEASATVVRSFQLALSYAFVLVALILYAFLRSVRDSLLVLGPILCAAVVTAGATVWLDMPFNFANIIALPLLVGVGVDNGIHMVHRMRTEPPKDGEPLHTSTSRAIVGSGLTTIASFGNLAFSAHVGMASMGQLLTLGMGMTMAATLLVLPAIMRSIGTR